MQDNTGQRTIRELDGDIALPPPGSALENWYLKVRDIKLSELETFDLARSCRQDIFIEELIPICIQILEEDPGGEDLYGEDLAAALRKNVDCDYWRTHPVERTRFLRAVSQAYQAYVEAGYDMTVEEDYHITEEDLLRPWKEAGLILIQALLMKGRQVVQPVKGH